MKKEIVLTSPAGPVLVTLDGRHILGTEPYEGASSPDESPEYSTLREALWTCSGCPEGYTLETKPVKWAPHFWDELARIPIGQIVTYGELAQRLGLPRHARAVGRALNSNLTAILLPCHRVVASGGIGGFGWGVDRKIRLLQHEQTLISKQSS
ncbi:MGMT family protein [Porphyromonas sp.]|uniref:MGMT family protein n=1 Tax=Porphyromonas sp. TaxID=1924944 RepID=UPI0026DC0E28|nr:MGMT family protein [Porphyromonas sp.]MDO4771912.1 MGMT family protein [Porphyromonas sp.]